jgi:methylenetetrahydrofolate dehydrogenase (NADP+)/methenyltetrahydrofolate cyclohydrolase
MATIIKAKELRDEMLEDVRGRVDFLRRLGKDTTLTIIQVEGDAASDVYVKQKCTKAQSAGITVRLVQFSNDATTEEVIEAVQEAQSGDNETDGVIVQLPLPDHIDEEFVLGFLDATHDADGLAPVSIGHLHSKYDEGYYALPATAKGIVYWLKALDVDFNNKNALVIGRSDLVGTPVARMLQHEGATVTVAHSHTSPDQLELFKTNADIIVVGIGIPKFITGENTKPNVIVIDAGINRLSDGPIVGDVDADTFSGTVSAVPGGVGLLTVAELLKTTVDLSISHAAKNMWGYK